MLFSSLLRLVPLVAVVQCSANNLCLTPEPPTKLVAAHHMLGAHEKASGTHVTSRDLPSQLSIDLYMHVIETEETKGQVTDDSVQKQVRHHSQKAKLFYLAT